MKIDDLRKHYILDDHYILVRDLPPLRDAKTDPPDDDREVLCYWPDGEHFAGEYNADFGWTSGYGDWWDGRDGNREPPAQYREILW